MKGKAAAKLGKELPTVLVLVGDEERGKERLLEQVKERVGAEASLISWGGDAPGKPEAELSRLLSDLASRPLFGGAKLIVARDGDGLIKRLGNGLLAAIKLDNGNRLLLMMRNLDNRTKLAKAIKKAGGLFTCMRPKSDLPDLPSGHAAASSELLSAVLEEADRLGLRLARDAALELAGRTGNDLFLVSKELEKLSLYLHGRDDAQVVNLRDVHELVPRSATWDQFRLFQEVATGDAQAALRRLRGMFQQGTIDRSGKRVTDPRSLSLALLAQLHNRLKLLARYRMLESSGLDRQQLQAALGIRNPGQLFYLGKEIRLPIVREADRALPALAEADRALKSSQPPAATLERLVIRLCGLVDRSRSQSAGRTRR